MLTVDHYESIRRAYHIEGKSKRQIARELGHSRKTVSKALKYSTPPPYSPRRVQPHPVLGDFTFIVDKGIGVRYVSWRCNIRAVRWLYI